MPKILVQSKPERLRRAGIEFTRQGVALDTDTLDEGVLEQLESEPLLAISDVVDDDAPATVTRKEAKAAAAKAAAPKKPTPAPAAKSKAVK